MKFLLKLIVIVLVILGAKFVYTEYVLPVLPSLPTVPSFNGATILNRTPLPEYQFPTDEPNIMSPTQEEIPMVKTLAPDEVVATWTPFYQMPTNTPEPTATLGEGCFNNGLGTICRAQPTPTPTMIKKIHNSSESKPRGQ